MSDVLPISVILCTHAPDASRLRRALTGLRDQTLASTAWETLLVDNASSAPLSLEEFRDVLPSNVRLVREKRLGLSNARQRGLREARGNLVVFVDDDNVLAPDYLECVAAIFARNSQLGAAGGRSIGEFELAPPSWAVEFFDLLALRDLGDHEETATTARPPESVRNVYPRCAPIGAGMALRREAIQTWLEYLDAGSNARPADRTGSVLTSGGDNDIVFSVLRAGWSVGYFPQLQLTHLIPSGRLDPRYLARLNRGIQRSWVQVLALHDACSWPAIAPWTVPLRVARAYLRAQAWRSPAHHIRWAGLRGRFEGQATLTSFAPRR